MPHVDPAALTSLAAFVTSLATLLTALAALRKAHQNHEIVLSVERTVNGGAEELKKQIAALKQEILAQELAGYPAAAPEKPHP